MISKDEYTCSICLGVFVDPCKLKCNHVFCHSCLLDLIDFNNIKYKCPMCRVEFVNKENPLSIDEELQNIVKENFPTVIYGNFFKFGKEILYLLIIRKTMRGIF